MPTMALANRVFLNIGRRAVVAEQLGVGVFIALKGSSGVLADF
jgi:ribose 5-phosphate isomerase RpiB